MPERLIIVETKPKFGYGNSHSQMGTVRIRTLIEQFYWLNICNHDKALGMSPGFTGDESSLINLTVAYNLPPTWQVISLRKLLYQNFLSKMA